MDDNTGRFTALEESECLELLRTSHVGRVAWQSGQGITILPITYAVHERTLIFRTAPDALLAELAHHHKVAFEVDSTDEETATGWSVLVRGHSAAPADQDRLAEIWQSPGRPEPWAQGERDLVVTVQISEISGRVVSRAD